MLKQASVEQVRNLQLPRENSHIVIAMCYYPRGIKKELSDEFRSELAPDRTLFTEWKEVEKAHGHDQAFITTRYEERFTLSPTGLYHLKKYSESPLDTYLVCQCKTGERCHREMLLLTGKLKYQAPIDKVFNSYPTYEKRIPDLNDKLAFW